MKLSTPSAAVCFIHIPKCGGTSISAAFYRAFGYHGLKERLGIGCNPVRLDSAASKRVVDRYHLDLHSYRHQLAHYLMESHEDSQFVHGHFPFGEKLHQRFADRFQFVTLLRHPVDRWLSHFYYAKENEGSPFHISQSLASYVRTEEAKSLGQQYTKYLTDPILHDDARKEKLINKAIDNLNRFDVVGVLEDTEAFARSFKEKVGFEIDIPHKNKTKTSYRLLDEVENNIGAIKACCRVDLEIYNHALSLIR